MIPSRGEPLASLRERAVGVMLRLRSGVRDLMTQAAVEGIILGVFDSFTREQLRDCIAGDIDVWGVAWGDLEELRPQLVALMADPVNAAVVRDLAVEDVVAWLRVQDARPDLVSVLINTAGGVEWLRRQVDTFKARLLAQQL